MHQSKKPQAHHKYHGDPIGLHCDLLCVLVDEMDDDEDEAATRRTTTRRSTIDYGNMLNITQSARHRERESLPPEYPSSHL